MEFSSDERAFVDEARDRILAHSRARRDAGLHDRIHAVVRSTSGKYYEGMSFETSLSHFDFCAERHAIGNMHYAETEAASFDAILVAGAVPDASESVITPCGACRHAIQQFAADATVFCSNFVRTEDDWDMFPAFERFTPGELYPAHNPLPTWE